MDLLIAPNTVPLADADTAPATGTPGYATDGDPSTGTARTPFPAYAWNAVQIELTTVMTKAGLILDKGDNTQLYQAIKIISEDGANNNCIGKASGNQDYSPLQGGVNISSGQMWFSYKDSNGNLKYVFSQVAGDYATNTALNAEVTRATTIENNLQSGKVNRNGDDGISGSFNVGDTFSVGTSFSAVAATGYGFAYRRTTTLTGAYDWYSDYSGIKVNILNLRSDGTLNVTGSGWLQVRGVNVALSTDVANLQSQVNGKQAAGDYATNTALNNGLAGKLDISTYQADFNSGDSRVHDSPYGKRTQHFRATANAGD
ncbi:hypothetical protein, partial [Acetobacter tropicalis]